MYLVTHERAKGVQLGRKPELTEHQRKKSTRRRDPGEETEETLAEIGRSYNISYSTISRLMTMSQRQPNAHAH